MINIPNLSTHRLLLRPFTKEDIPAAYAMNKDQEVSKYTGDGGVVSYAEMERRIVEDVLGDYQKYGYGRLAVVLKESQDFIGFAGLKYIPELQEVDLGYRFFSKYWGKGYATEAAKACLHYGFEDLQLQHIIATVLPENKASIHVLNKMGFQFEKEYREDGEAALLYALSAADFKKSKA